MIDQNEVSIEQQLQDWAEDLTRKVEALPGQTVRAGGRRGRAPLLVAAAALLLIGAGAAALLWNDGPKSSQLSTGAPTVEVPPPSLTAASSIPASGGKACSDNGLCVLVEPGVNGALFEATVQWGDSRTRQGVSLCSLGVLQNGSSFTALTGEDEEGWIGFAPSGLPPVSVRGVALHQQEVVYEGYRIHAFAYDGPPLGAEELNDAFAAALGDRSANTEPVAGCGDGVPG